MSLGILTNVSAIYAENNLNQTQAALQTTLQQLSSGSRINSGADDAAGLSIASSLGANIAALTQSQQNASNGVGLLQTADGALSQVTNLLDRAVTLATEAANGGLTTTQISSANQEYQNILTEISNIGTTTNFNSTGVFSNTATSYLVSDGTASGASTFSDKIGILSTSSVGQTTNGTGSVASTAAGTPTNTGVSDVDTASTATVGAYSTITLGTATNTLSGSISVVSDHATTAYAPVVTNFTAGTTIAQAVQQLNQQYSAAGNGLVASVKAGGAGIVITGAPDGTIGDNAVVTTVTSLLQSTIAVNGSAGQGIDFTQASDATLTAATAATVLTQSTSAIADVAFQRGIIGADINELNSASAVASSESVNLTTAQSSILSTNYGQATSALANYQVLSQTGISALAQANTVQQEVLKLLQ
jgi:flagellin